jgi:hypothetical protein
VLALTSVALFTACLAIGPAEQVESAEAPLAEAELGAPVEGDAPEADVPEADAPTDTETETEIATEDIPVDVDAASGEAVPEEGAETVEPEPEVSAPEPQPEPTLIPDHRPEPVPIDVRPQFEAHDDFDPMRHTPDAIRARGWLRSGIVATSAGVVLGVAAVVTGTLDPCTPKAGNNCFEDARNRAAITIGIPAGLLLAGGVTMTAIGATRLKKLRAGLVASDGRFGVSLSGRF